MQSVILTFYVGTQSIRAVMMNSVGELLHSVKNEYQQPFFSRYSGWTEQRAEFYWEILCETSKELKEKAGSDWNKIKGVTVSTIRDSVVCVDEEGRPIRPAILWMDKRESEHSKDIPLFNKMVFRVSNMLETANTVSKASACNWIMENEPEIWNRTYKFLMLSGYLYYKLVGKFVDSRANVVGHVPFNYKKGRWMKSNELMYCLFPVPQNKLCYLCEPEETAGYIMEEASELTGIPEGIPLIATGSNRGCEAIGLSCITPEKAAINLGTTTSIQYTTPKYVEPQSCLPPYCSPYKGMYSAEIEIYRGDLLISWFQKEFADKEAKEAQIIGIGLEDLLNKKLADVAPGCNGLVFQPYFSTEYSMMNSRGAMIGLSGIHTRGHIYRAIIEGINYALLDAMETLQERLDVKTEGIYVSGHSSKSDELCQILADVTGLSVYRVQTPDAGIIGSSIVGLKGLGVFNSIEDGVRNMVHIQKPFRPNIKTHETYQRLYRKVFLHMFDRLSPLYDSVQTATGY